MAAEERDRLFQADKPVKMMEIAMKMARTHHKWVTYYIRQMSVVSPAET